jgi:t-SNARE complex subunit (syntaxin)
MEKSRSQINEDLKLERSVLEEAKNSSEFKETNQLLFIELNKSDQVLESTQETVFQLSSLLKHFSQIVDEQESMSLNILTDAENSVQNMKTANVELQSANERSKGYEKIWAAYFLTLTIILLFYDWKTSRVVYIVD